MSLSHPYDNTALGPFYIKLTSHFLLESSFSQLSNFFDLKDLAFGLLIIELKFIHLSFSLILEELSWYWGLGICDCTLDNISNIVDSNVHYEFSFF